MAGLIKILKSVLAVLILHCFFLLPTNAQCIDFAKNICKEQLGNFKHDGNYNATKLGAGETAELYKTFFSQNEYRLYICQENTTNKVQFLIIDENNNVLFDNSKHNFNDTWDFSVQSTQMLIIKLKVIGDETKGKDTSCIAVLFGIR